MIFDIILDNIGLINCNAVPFVLVVKLEGVRENVL